MGDERSDAVDEALAEPLAEPEEPAWAEEIKRLRAARGDRLAAQLADEDRKEPPVE
jgi:hypothetical protein